MEPQQPWDDSVAFSLVRLGAVAHRRYAELLSDLGLRPRQVGVLEQLRAGPMSQLELATTLGVTPSVVVDMVDELERLEAVRRVRDTVDRRRSNLELTDRGRELGRSTREVAAGLDEELLAGIDPDHARTLRAVLRRMLPPRGLRQEA
ncbi:MAG TPA: MarR family transcriptional regulator [Candidatus Dormibacteraeota bacterium]|nr:MarR family transcriptional regulator [Candidatus Dormibacteraeota bacterium]